MKRIDRLLTGRRQEFVIVLVLTLLGFLFYLLIFQANELLPNVDGPYYLIQVRGILEGDGLVYGDPPLAFYLLSIFAYLTGDISYGVKVGMSILCSVAAIPAYFLMKRLGKGSLPGILGMLLVVFSAPFIRMMTDFMKNAIGICWLLSFIYYLHDLSLRNPRTSSLAFASFFLILTGLTHILVFGVALLFLGIFTVFVMLSTQNRRPFLKTFTVILVVVVAFVSIASIFFSPLFTDFNKIFSFLGDLGESQSGIRQTSMVQSQVPLPPQGPEPGGSSTPVTGGWGMVVLVISSGAFISIHLWRRGNREAFLVLATTTVVGMIIFFPSIPGEWLSRFLLMIVVPNSIVFSYAVSGVWYNDSGTDDNLAFLPKVFGVACVLFFAVQAVLFSLSVAPTINDAEYADLRQMGEIIPDNSLVIAPRQHGVGYWVEYLVDAKVLGQGEEPSADLWASYDSIFAIIDRKQVRRDGNAVYEGSEMVLVEVGGIDELRDLARIVPIGFG